MTKYHVHIFKVTHETQLDIDAGSGEEARQTAFENIMDREARGENIEWEEAGIGSDYIILSFGENESIGKVSVSRSEKDG